MSAQQPAANPLFPDAPYWLPPVHFGLKAYLELCQSFDKALADLEALYPSPPRTLTIETRNSLLRRRPK
jgi:hypothetical protein